MLPAMGDLPCRAAEAVEHDPGSGVARFWWDLRTDQWTWSPELYAMHGVDPDQVITTEFFLSCKHPEDREYAMNVITWAKRTGEPFSCRHRIVRVADGAVRTVAVVGQVDRDRDGASASMKGYFIDVTDAPGGGPEPSADVRNAQLRGALERARQEIEELRRRLSDGSFARRAGGDPDGAAAAAAVTLKLAGEIDLTNRPWLIGRLRWLESAAHRGYDVHLDTRELAFIDVKSTILLIELAARLPEGRRMIVDLCPALSRVLSVWPASLSRMAFITPAGPL